MQSVLSIMIIASMLGQFITGAVQPATSRIFAPTETTNIQPADSNSLASNACGAIYLPIILNSSAGAPNSQVQKVASTPSNAASLRGRILDANDASQGVETPLISATITSLETGHSTQTDEDGCFLLSELPAGELHIEYNGGTALPLNTYASYRAKVTLTENTVTKIIRPIYLMKIDSAGQVAVDPNSTTTLENPNLGIKVIIPPHTVKDEAGNDFEGMISISEVPADFTPGSLPDTLDPGLVVTIQPMGLTFDQPAPVTFPNTDNLPAGTELDIWSMDHESSQFFIAGRGRVTSNGQEIETISGGIREASWHFFLALALLFSLLPVPDLDGNNQSCSTTPKEPFTSLLTPHNGSIQTGFALPGYVSMGETRSLDFVYNANRAWPLQLVPVEPTIPSQAAIPNKLSVSYMDGGAMLGETSYLSNTGLVRNQPLRAVVPVDTSSFETGIYNHSLRLTSYYNNSAVTAVDNNRLLVVNEQNSPFGAGWGLAGLQRLHIEDREEILLTEGSGKALHFIPSKPFVFGGFDGERGGTLSSYIEGTYETGLRASLEENFPDVSYQAFPLLTTDVLSNVDVLILASIRYPSPRLVSLSSSEQTVLSDFVSGGKCAVLISENNAHGGAGTPAANESFLDPFGMDITGSISTRRILVSIDKPQLSTLTDGYFGTINQFSQGAPGGISNLGPYARSLGDNAIGTALALIEPGEITSQAGPVIIYSDHRTFVSSAGFLDYFPENENLFLNTIDYCLNNIDLLPVTEYQSPDGDYTTLSKNNNGTFTRRTKSGIEFHFDSQGLQTQTVDRNGNTTSYSYDGQGRLTSITDPADQVTTLAYSGNSLSSVTDPASRVTTFSYTGNDLTGVRFPDGTTQSFSYDARHLMTSETDRRGFEKTRIYDLYGRVTEATMPDGSVRSTSASQAIGLVDPDTGVGTEANPAPVVRPDEALSKIIDGEGRTRSFTSGPVNSLASVTDPADLTTTYGRDENGNLTQIQQPSGAIYDQGYDDAGNLVSIIDQTLNGTTNFAYENTYNQIVSVTDPFNNVTGFGYDGMGNLTRTTTALNRTASFEYDNRGLLTRAVDPLGTETTFNYDSIGNLSRIAAGSGAARRITNLTTTAAGYLDTLTDPLGRVYDYDYDDFGRITRESLPGSGRVINYDYDNAGNLTSLTPPGQPAHSFAYNDLGLVDTYTAPSVAGGGTNQTVFAYNNAQEVTQVTRPDGQTLDYAYDNAGRLDTLTIPRGQLTYSYDATSGYLTSLAAPDNVNLAYSYNKDLLTQVAWSGPVNGNIVYTYDKKGRITRLRVNNQTAGQVDYSYDADDRIIGAGQLSLTYDSQTGLLERTSLSNINDSWNFNDFAELSRYTANVGSTPFFDLQYAHDTLGRIISKTEMISDTSTAYSYRYDAAGRLDQVLTDGIISEQYTYDPNGNRQTALGGVTASYDNQDRLLTYGANSYSYTPNGELQSKTQGSAVTTYSYDVLGNLLDVTLPDSTAITYLVDGEGRRVGKKVNGTLQQGFLYQDGLNPVVELDGAGAIVAWFAYASKANMPDYMAKNSTPYHLITDHLGSVRLVVNARNGVVAQRLDYDAFGRVILDTNPGFQPFGFAGGLYDPDTGLVRFGARDYDAEVGWWTAKDPIGFAGGDANLYGYVGNDPVNLVDVSGQSLLGSVANFLNIDPTTLKNGTIVGGAITSLVVNGPKIAQEFIKKGLGGFSAGFSIGYYGGHLIDNIFEYYIGREGVDKFLLDVVRDGPKDLLNWSQNKINNLIDLLVCTQ